MAKSRKFQPPKTEPTQTKQTPRPATVEETVAVPVALFDEIESLTTDSMACLTNPECWPLAPDEQARFIKSTLYRIRKYAQSEPYLRVKLMRALQRKLAFDAKANTPK